MSLVKADHVPINRPTSSSSRLVIYAIVCRRQIKRGLNQWAQWLGNDDTALILHITALLMMAMKLA